MVKVVKKNGNGGSLQDSPRRSKSGGEEEKGLGKRRRMRSNSKILDGSGVSSTLVRHVRPRTDGRGFVPKQASGEAAKYPLFPRHILMAKLPKHFPMAPKDDEDVWEGCRSVINGVLKCICAEDFALIQHIRRWRAAWLITRADAHIPTVICGSKSVTEVLGWPENEVIGKNMMNTLLSNDTDDDGFKYVRRMLRTHTEHHCLVGNKHKDGRMYKDSICIVMLRSKSGSVKYHLCIFKSVGLLSESDATAAARAVESEASSSEPSEARKLFDKMLADTVGAPSSVSSESYSVGSSTGSSITSSTSSSTNPWISIMDMSRTTSPACALSDDGDGGSSSSSDGGASGAETGESVSKIVRNMVNIAEQVGLTAVIVTNPSIMSCRDKLGPVVFASTRFLEYTGLETSEIFGSYLSDIFVLRGKYEKVLEILESHVERGEDIVKPIEVSLRRNASEPLKCFVELRVVKDVRGIASRAILMVLRCDEGGKVPEPSVVPIQTTSSESSGDESNGNRED